MSVLSVCCYLSMRSLYWDWSQLSSSRSTSSSTYTLSLAARLARSLSSLSSGVRVDGSSGRGRIWSGDLEYGSMTE